jgi:hypothetical protein
MADAYLQKIQEHWDEITGVYVAFEEKAPVLEFDAIRLRIIAYPAQDYLDGLSDRTREQAKRQYSEATAEGALMVFVRDEEKRVLRSYVFPRDDG